MDAMRGAIGPHQAEAGASIWESHILCLLGENPRFPGKGETCSNAEAGGPVDSVCGVSVRGKQ